jgi:hypothetical protein
MGLCALGDPGSFLIVLVVCNLSAPDTMATPDAPDTAETATEEPLITVNVPSGEPLGITFAWREGYGLCVVSLDIQKRDQLPETVITTHARQS